MKRLIIPIILAATLIFSCEGNPNALQAIADLHENQNVSGFIASKVYENGAGQPMGARFIDNRTGFIVDLMYIESVPQAFFWVKSPPTTDMGRPHTCEHLLLGKGNLGRYVATQEDMTLSTSTAYTAQVRTAYHFNTVGGDEAFKTIFEAKLNALINPDFTDEETRREVKHFGVLEDEETGELSIEEKGTVYTEMVSSFEKPWYHYMSPLAQMIYGDGHPMSNSSGGIPEDIGKMTAEDMRVFVEETYHLGNMGAIVALPSSQNMEDFLAQLAEMLPEIQSDPRPSRSSGITALDLPPAEPETPGKILLTNYPSPNDQDPGFLIYGWPAIPDLNARETFLADLFFNTFSNGATSNLYKLFINSETRQLDLGAQYVWGSVDTDFGASPYFSLGQVNDAQIRIGMAEQVRTLVYDELETLYNLPDNSDELLAFNAVAKSRLIEQHKQTQDYLNSPPMFGFRGGSAGGWLSLMGSLELEEDFRISLVQADHTAEVQKQLDSGMNIWRSIIDRMELISVPAYGVACNSDPGLLAKAEEKKVLRLKQKIDEYKAEFKTDDDQEALRRYRVGFDENTAELEAIAAKQTLPGFLKNPPLEIDGQLEYEMETLSNGIEMFAATIENMGSATFRIYLDVNQVAADQLMYLPSLPALMTATGVVRDGEVIEYEDMQDQLRQEILDLSCWYSTNGNVGRNELVLSAKGGDMEEAKAALNWASLALYNPFLETDNLPRIRDLIDQELGGYRNQTKRSEESWVRNPQRAYQYQNDAVYLSTASFLTELHHTLRLKFQFMDPDEETSEVLVNLSGMSGSDRSAISTKLERLHKSSSNPTLTNTIEELQQELVGLPESSFAQDWKYLCDQLNADLNVEPESALENIQTILADLQTTSGARLAMVSNSNMKSMLDSDIETFVSGLRPGSAGEKEIEPESHIVRRLMSRDNSITEDPVYVGLLFEGTRNGVLMYSAKLTDIYDSDEKAILTNLAGKMYSGGGPHGFFMNTWSAGLAYSNGYRFDQRGGRASYYAERCPDVAETMRFVVDLIKSGEISEEMLDYATAQVFGVSRTQSPYETRAFAMAADLEDGYTPERVRAYRKQVLKMRSQENLRERIIERLEAAYGPVLVGYGDALSSSEEGIYYLIGPAPQFESMDEEIEKHDPGQSIVKLYPRDYWIIPEGLAI